MDVLSMRESGELEAGNVTVLIPNGREVQRVGIEWTPCTFGGVRRGFFCRLCGNLAYREENETQSGRALLKAKRLHVRLGGTGNLFEELPEKPPEMSSRTYERLLERGEAAKQEAFETIEEKLRASSARLGRIRKRSRR